MSTLETQPQSFERFEKDVPWYMKYPFSDEEPYGVKVAAEKARYLSAAPDPAGLKLASILIYTSTPAMTIGMSPVPPGDWFTPGNHPNAEAYFLLSGEMSIFNPETGQYELMKTGDAYAIPAMSFHGGINTSDETADILWAIPKHVWTEEFRANPEYDEHYSLFRDPIALNREAVHSYQKHDSWAQPGWRPDGAPESYLDDLRCWPPRDGRRLHRDHDVDHVVMTERDWLHFATGSDYGHMIMTSFCYAQPDFQAGRVRLPMGRVSSRITSPGERVYFPRGDKPFTVILSDSKDALTGVEGDALYVPAGVTHQVHNINAHVIDALFFGATPEGVTFTD